MGEKKDNINADSPIEDVMGAIFGKINESSSLKELGELINLWDRLHKDSEITLRRMEQLRNSDDDIDRLGVLIQVINDFKEMGFEVSISISPIQLPHETKL